MTSLVLTYLFHVLPALTSHSFAECVLATGVQDVCNQPHFHAGDDRERCLDAYPGSGQTAQYIFERSRVWLQAAKASELRSQSRDSRLASLSSALMSLIQVI